MEISLGICHKVEQLLKSMKEHPLQVCYTPTHDLNGDIKVTYLNTVSLHKYFYDDQHSHNIISSDAFILSGTRVSKLDEDTVFHISQFIGPYTCRNDKECNITTYPPCGMAAYIKNNLCLLNTKILNDNAFEATILSFYHKKFPL